MAAGDTMTVALNQDFRCTECGQCCRNFRLPLRLSEAPRWLADGNPLEVLCQAIPWPIEPPASDAVGQYQRQRSFAAQSGQLPVRILVTLAAPLGDGCPNLDKQQRCQIYERRPLACRIYPAETSPFQVLQPALRRCPPDAWAPGMPPLLRDGRWVGAELTRDLQQQATLQMEDALKLEAFCGALGIRQAALATEGYVVHQLDAAQLKTALQAATASPLGAKLDISAELAFNAEAEPKAVPVPQNWALLSARSESIETLLCAAARAQLAADAQATAKHRFSFLSLLAS